METMVVTVDPFNPDERVLETCASLLRSGGLVAFPTETVYGLGANALDARAVLKIFQAKGRPQDNPLIVHVARMEQVEPLVQDIGPTARRLIEAFWPGPLTLLFRKREIIPPEVTAGLPLVAIRMPDHPVAHRLIDLAGVPIAAPSANLSGRPSPTTAQDVLQDLSGKIDLIVDGGPANIGVESTVLDISGPRPRMLRPGGVSREELEAILGHVDIVETAGEPSERPLPSPGMKYTHYSPRALVFLAKGPPHEQKQAVLLAGLRWVLADKKVVVLASSENLEAYEALEKTYPARFRVLELGSRDDLAPVAARLFSSLRFADVLQADIVISETFPTTGLGLAIANRLERASGGKELSFPGLRPFTVLMVCSGNTCRSPMAEGLLTKLWRDAGEPFPIKVISRGTNAFPGFPASPEAVSVMKGRGIDLSGHSSWPVAEKDLADADIVIAMTRSHKGTLLTRFPQHSHKIWTLSELVPAEVPGDVDDPLGKGQDFYDRTAAVLERGLLALIKRLSASWWRK